MSNGFKDKKKKFHPINNKKGVRKSRDQKAKTQGVKLRKKSEPFKVGKTKGATQQELVQMQRADVGRRKHDDEAEDLQLIQQEIKKHERDLHGMSKNQMMEWENVAGSEIVKVKHEMINGRPVTTVRFANGEEWFEFDDIEHQEEFIKKHKIDIDHEKVGEFVEIDHPMVAGYYTMPSGKIAFGEREDRKKKLVTIYPYKNQARRLSKLDYHKLPDELKDDLSELSYHSGQMVFTDVVTEWNEMTELEKKEFLEGIRDYN